MQLTIGIVPPLVSTGVRDGFHTHVVELRVVVQSNKCEASLS
jgi:hypothetical protein